MQVYYINLSFSFIDHMSRLGIATVFTDAFRVLFGVIMVVKHMNVSVHAMTSNCYTVGLLQVTLRQ